jgi:hypothetical protein
VSPPIGLILGSPVAAGPSFSAVPVAVEVYVEVVGSVG